MCLSGGASASTSALPPSAGNSRILGRGACRERRTRCPVRVRLLTSTSLLNCWRTSAERSFSPPFVSVQLLMVIDQMVER